VCGLPSKPVDCGSKHELLANIEAYLHRYVDLSPLFDASRLITCSHLGLRRIRRAAYLRLKGDFGTGKTRTLMALGSIVYKGFFASGASTVSPIFHTLDRFGGTLILDEADLRFSDKTADLVKILNNGTVRAYRGSARSRMPQNAFNPLLHCLRTEDRRYARGFRGRRAREPLPHENMGTRPLRNDIPIQLPEHWRSALGLRNRLLHFRLTNLFQSGATGPLLSAALIRASTSWRARSFR